MQVYREKGVARRIRLLSHFLLEKIIVVTVHIQDYPPHGLGTDCNLRRLGAGHILRRLDTGTLLDIGRRGVTPDAAISCGISLNGINRHRTPERKFHQSRTEFLSAHICAHPILTERRTQRHVVNTVRISLPHVMSAHRNLDAGIKRALLFQNLIGKPDVEQNGHHKN